MQTNDINELEKLLLEQEEKSEKMVLKAQRSAVRWSVLVTVMIIISGCVWSSVFNKAIYGFYVKVAHPSPMPWFDRIEDAVAVGVMNIFTGLLVGMLAFQYFKVIFFKK